jgi:hypothetical protein
VLNSSGWAGQHDVAGLGEESAGGQGRDLLADGALGVEVEVLEGFAGGEGGGPDRQLGAGGAAGGDFPFQDGGQVVLMRPARVAGLRREPGRRLGDARRLERGLASSAGCGRRAVRSGARGPRIQRPPE